MQTRRLQLRLWLRLAPALAVAILGWQIGERAWRQPHAPIVGRDAATSHAPVAALPPLQTPNVLPRMGLDGADPNPFALAISPLTRPTAPAPQIGPPAPSTPAQAIAGHRTESFTGPIPGAGREYDGRPLPLPSLDQVRFLLRREPVAALRPVSPLSIAPPLVAGRLATNDPRASTNKGRAVPNPPRVVMGPRLPMGPPPPGSARLTPAPEQRPIAAATSAPSGTAGEPGRAAPAPPPPSPATADASAAEARGASPMEAVDTAPSATVPKPNAATPAALPPSSGTTTPPDASLSPRPRSPVAGQAPLHLQLQVVAGRVRAGGASGISVRIVASAPGHVAAYQVDAAGRVTPLLPASGAALMPASTSFRLAPRARVGIPARVVALASQQPLSARVLYRCLLAYLAAPHGAAPDGNASPTAAAALTAVSGYLARQAAADLPLGVGAATEPLPERGLWDVGVSPVFK